MSETLNLFGGDGGDHPRSKNYMVNDHGPGPEGARCGGCVHKLTTQDHCAQQKCLDDYPILNTYPACSLFKSVEWS